MAGWRGPCGARVGGHRWSDGAPGPMRPTWSARRARIMGDRDRYRSGALSRREFLAFTAAAGGAAAVVSRLGPAATLAQEEPLGSQLIGELEGPIVLVDAPRPASLKQAPMLDELVQAGTLPPVEQRVPEEPLVIQPLEGIGTYGGTLRRGFTGPGDDENGNRYVSGD